VISGFDDAFSTENRACEHGIFFSIWGLKVIEAYRAASNDWPRATCGSGDHNRKDDNGPLPIRFSMVRKMQGMRFGPVSPGALLGGCTGELGEEAFGKSMRTDDEMCLSSKRARCHRLPATGKARDGSSNEASIARRQFGCERYVPGRPRSRD
jgi:hypothetical protein